MINQKIDPIFKSLDEQGSRRLQLGRVGATLAASGIRADDRRIADFWARLESGAIDSSVDLTVFETAIGEGAALFERVVKRDLVIPDFEQFSQRVESIFEHVGHNTEGQVADYIPQLARVSPEHFGLSICTIDGQRLTLGDVGVDFSVQSCCKPINYCMALEGSSTEYVHRHVLHLP